MEHEELNAWISRKRKNIIAIHELKYFAHPKRDKYLNFFQDKLLRFFLSIEDDPYKMKIIELYKEGGFMLESLPKILKKVEEKRVWFKDQMFFGKEYSQPYIHVSSFVKIENEREIVRFLMWFEVTSFFLKFIPQLEKAIKRGVIGMQEEKILFAKAKQGILPDKKESPQPLVGFFWEGRDVAMKIKTLHDGLVAGEFIERKTTLEQFTILFKGIPVDKPVLWRGTNSQLVYLIGALYSKNLLAIPEELKTLNKQDIKSEQAYGSWLYSKLSACFTDKHGKPLLAKNLKHTKSDIENKGRTTSRANELQNIVREVVKATFLNSVASKENKN
ncbi:MAG: hypothetical protein ABIQ40_08515 [Bacteroidia bacterium]